MSKEAVLKFREQVNCDRAIQGEIRNAESIDLVAIAQARGFEFSAEDLHAVADENGGELSDFELEMVAGGNIIRDIPGSLKRVGCV
jgi:predicted ribosomally synthesized peptide with nif11-like leader